MTITDDYLTACRQLADFYRGAAAALLLACIALGLLAGYYRRTRR